MENRRSRRKPGMREETEREIISRQRTTGRRRRSSRRQPGRVRAEAVTGQEAAGSRKRFRWKKKILSFRVLIAGELPVSLCV
ncbi:MAG: hypothetical protein ACLR8P_09745 [Clostridium fessum]